MDNDLNPKSLMSKPTQNRPLLDLTLQAEDGGRYSCEAMRFMVLSRGARLRCADIIQSVKRHLWVYMPSVIIVDNDLLDVFPPSKPFGLRLVSS